MTCSGCERAIQNILGKLDGMESAKADSKTSTLSVEYDPDKVTVDEIRSAVNRIGYKFVGERPPLGQREGRDDAVS